MTRLDRARPWVASLYVLTAATAAVQRVLGAHPHWTYPVFRESFYHLARHQDMYAHYAAQGYDLFKYSPTFAVLFAPFSLLPFGAGLVAWDVANALVLWAALDHLLPRRDAVLAALLVYPEMLVAAQASQSNSLVAALIILAFIAFEHRRELGAAAAIGVGAAIKIFPLAALAFALPHPRRARFALRFAAVAVALLALPLVLVPPAVLAGEYRSWMGVEHTDTLDRGASVMGLLARVAPGGWPNWPVQLAGTLLLLLPLVLRRERWREASFRLRFLASLLIYVVIFNHQAERPSFVIAAAGSAIWWAISPRTAWRTALVLLCLVGLKAAPFLLVWIVIQRELLATRDSPRAIPAGSSPS